MFRIITQDGRTLEVKRNPDVHERFTAWTSHNTNRYPELENAVKVTLDTNPRKVPCKIKYSANGKEREIDSTYWAYDKVLDEVVGYFDTETSRDKIAQAIEAAWKRGDSQFVVPQDSFPKTDAERFNDFCEKNHLLCVSINELGYKQSDIPRNRLIWQTSDEFERKNILVADSDGSYETSLNKWKNLHKEALTA